MLIWNIELGSYVMVWQWVWQSDPCQGRDKAGAKSVPWPSQNEAKSTCWKNSSSNQPNSEGYLWILRIISYFEDYWGSTSSKKVSRKVYELFEIWYSLSICTKNWSNVVEKAFKITTIFECQIIALCDPMGGVCDGNGGGGLLTAVGVGTTVCRLIRSSTLMFGITVAAV